MVLKNTLHEGPEPSEGSQQVPSSDQSTIELFATVPTFIKLSITDSSELENYTEKCLINAGVFTIKDELGPVAAGHILVQPVEVGLDPRCEITEGFIFIDHFQGI